MMPAGYAWLFIIIYVIGFETWAIKHDSWTLSEFIWHMGDTHQWFKYLALSLFGLLLNHLFGRK